MTKTLENGRESVGNIGGGEDARRSARQRL